MNMLKVKKYFLLIKEELQNKLSLHILHQEKLQKNKLKTIEDQESKKIDVITNQNEILAALTNKDGHKGNYLEIFEKLVKERIDETKELTHETNHDDLLYYFKANTARKKNYDFNNGIEVFRKMQSGERRQEEAKKKKYI